MMADTPARILCVDDEAHVQSALRRALRKEPYELFFASSGPEALLFLEKQEVDLMITDHLMPGMTGLELVRKVNARWPNILRLILTGHADLDMAIDAINRGEVYRFLTKPWDNLDIRIILRLAVSRLELERENKRLIETVKRQSEFIATMERTYPGIEQVPGGGPNDAIIISEAELASAAH